MSPVILHFLTVPTQQAWALPYPTDDRKPPAGTKDPAKIAAWREADEKKWGAERAEKCAQSPRESRFLQVAILPADGASAPTFHVARTEADEPALLRAVWDTIAEARGHVVTWNGAIRLQTLIARSALHDVDPGMGSFAIRHWSRPGSMTHTDLKLQLTSDKYATDSLAKWTESFGLPGRVDALDAKAVLECATKGEYAPLQEAAHADLDAMAAILERVRPFCDVGTWQARDERVGASPRTADAGLGDFGAAPSALHDVAAAFGTPLVAVAARVQPEGGAEHRMIPAPVTLEGGVAPTTPTVNAASPLGVSS